MVMWDIRYAVLLVTFSIMSLILVNLVRGNRSSKHSGLLLGSLHYPRGSPIQWLLLCSFRSLRKSPRARECADSSLSVSVKGGGQRHIKCGPHIGCGPCGDLRSNFS